MSESAFDIAATGMAAHRLEMNLIAENLANAGTMRTGGGAPYRSRAAIFEPEDSSEGMTFADSLDGALDDETAAATGVRFAGVLESNAPPQYRYDPGNPLAIESGPQRGLVALPDVDPIEQMVSLLSAGRAYDADIATLQAAKQMDVEAIEVDRS